MGVVSFEQIELESIVGRQRNDDSKALEDTFGLSTTGINTDGSNSNSAIQPPSAFADSTIQ